MALVKVGGSLTHGARLSAPHEDARATPWRRAILWLKRTRQGPRQWPAQNYGVQELAVGVLSVRHLTTYHYSQPVELGEHRMMFRPRDSHDLRLIRTRLSITPQPVDLHWRHDVFDNSVAVAEFRLRDDLAAVRQHGDAGTFRDETARLRLGGFPPGASRSMPHGMNGPISRRRCSDRSRQWRSISGPPDSRPAESCPPGPSTRDVRPTATPSARWICCARWRSASGRSFATSDAWSVACRAASHGDSAPG